MFRFEKLEVWNESVEYAKKIYILSEKLPKNEIYGLTAQIKRASLSISSNIAEGSGGASINDFCHYLNIAIKSTIETVSQLLFAKNMGYIKDYDIKYLYNEAELLVKRIQALKLYLRKSERKDIK